MVYPYTDKTQVADPAPFRLPIGDEPHIQAVLNQLLGAGTWGKGIAAPGEQGHILEPEVVVFNWPVAPQRRHADMYGGVPARDRVCISAQCLCHVCVRARARVSLCVSRAMCSGRRSH